MNQWDLIGWAFAVAASLLIIAGPLAVVAAAITIGRGKL